MIIRSWYIISCHSSELEYVKFHLTPLWMDIRVYTWTRCHLHVSSFSFIAYYYAEKKGSLWLAQYFDGPSTMLKWIDRFYAMTCLLSIQVHRLHRCIFHDSGSRMGSGNSDYEAKPAQKRHPPELYGWSSLILLWANGPPPSFQITMIVYGFAMCMFLKPYPTFPWPGYRKFEIFFEKILV